MDVPAQEQAIDPFRTAGASEEKDSRSTGNPALRREFGNIRSVRFVDTPVTDIFTMISDLTGWSIIMSPDVSKSPPRINIWVKDMPPDKVLEEVVSVAGLVLDLKEGIYNVFTFDEYTRLRGVEKKVLPLKNVRAEEIVRILKPFVRQDEQARIIADPSTNHVVLLVPAPLLASFENLIRTLDVSFEKEVMEVIRLRHLSVDVLLPELNAFLKGVSAEPGAGTALKPGQTEGAVVPQSMENWLVQFMAEPRLNAIVVRGFPDYVRQAAELIRQLDVEAEGDALRIVPLHYQEAGLLVSALEDFLSRSSQTYQESPSEGRLTAGTRMEIWPIRFMADTKFNSVIIRGKADYVEKVLDLIRRLDKEPALEARYYALKYTTAENAYRILKELITEEELAGRTSGRSAVRLPPRIRIAANPQNNSILIEGSPKDHERFEKTIRAIDIPMPSGSGGMRVYRLENTSSSEVAKVLQSLIKDRNELAKQQKTGPDKKAPSARDTTQPASPSAVSPTDTERPSAVQEGFDILPAVITEAPEINAVIISASAAEHEEFGTIIRELDKPREQVVLEVTLVSIQNTDSFELGVELGSELRSGGTQMIGFSNFGIGVKNPATGDITFPTKPAFGLNAAIFNSDDFSLVLNALKTVGKTRITSSPKVLVEDNAVGYISQTTEEPYESVSQGENSTITSFGGFVEAGTILQVVPRIAEGDWLRLEYQIQLSSFGTRTEEQQQANLPPPREKNIIQGSVRIPTGHTVVLGGLVTGRQDDVRQEIPLLGSIPIIGNLFRDLSLSRSSNTLFIFIRPEVLRDLQYRDLLRISEQEADRAKLDLHQELVNSMIFLLPSQTEDFQ